MRLAGLLLACKQTRTSVMSVAGAAGWRERVRGVEDVANHNRAKSFNVSCALSRAPAQQEMLCDNCNFFFVELFLREKYIQSLLCTNKMLPYTAVVNPCCIHLGNDLHGFQLHVITSCAALSQCNKLTASNAIRTNGY